MSCELCSGYYCQGRCPCCYDPDIPIWLEDLATNTYAEIRLKIADGTIWHSDEIHEYLATKASGLNEDEQLWWDESSWEELNEFFNLGETCPSIKDDRALKEILSTLPEEIGSRVLENLIKIEENSRIVLSAGCDANSVDHIRLVVRPAVEDAFRAEMFDDNTISVIKANWMVKNAVPNNDSGVTQPYEIEILLTNRVSQILYEKYQIYI